MSIKVIIKRKFSEEMDAFLTPLLKELRDQAMKQPGYISGETFKRVDGPPEIMVIGTWRSIEDWKTWVATRERSDIQTQIDTLIGKETVYEIYAPR